MAPCLRKVLGHGAEQKLRAGDRRWGQEATRLHAESWGRKNSQKDSLDLERGPSHLHGEHRATHVFGKVLRSGRE